MYKLHYDNFLMNEHDDDVYSVVQVLELTHTETCVVISLLV